MISRKIADQMQQGSWIRRMFEEGSRLKQLHGADKVFDFSIGNPDLEPPEAVLTAMEEISRARIPGSHGYMNNAGYQEVRSLIAQDLGRAAGMDLDAAAVCMTTGAAGAMNVALKALLDPGDEVIVLAPYFVEYLSYIDNHGGVPVIVSCDSATLMPDPAVLRRAISAKTKAVIINSPNNPSGMVYPAELLRSINAVLREYPRPIYVISDEPYNELVYDGLKVPSTLACLDNSLICYSWSKTLSLPGERIGYLAVSPRCPDYDDLINAVTYCNRVLGFVNAPAFFQRVLLQARGARVDVSRYEKRRNRLMEILRRAGLSAHLPQGGFYLFPQTPITDDTAFAAACARHNILLVPGRGFGFAGYVRLCFAVSEDVIERSAAAFTEIGREFGLI